MAASRPLLEVIGILGKQRQATRLARLERWTSSPQPRNGVRLSMSDVSTSDTHSDDQQDCSPRESNEEPGRSELHGEPAARLQRWLQTMGDPSSRDAYYGRPRRAEDAGQTALRETLEWRGDRNCPRLSVQTDLLPDSSLQTQMQIGETLMASVSSWSVDGGRENMAVVSAIGSDGTAEVVYRRVTIDLTGERPCDVTVSGDMSTLGSLLERTAARHATSTGAMLRSLSAVGSAQRVLSLSLPDAFLQRFA